MGALKPRGILGPLEAVKEGRSYVVRVPLDGSGESLVLVLTEQEARDLGMQLRDEVAAASGR